MKKKILTYTFIVIGLIVGMMVSLMLAYGWKEEWVYKIFGKERVHRFMDKYDRFIIKDPDRFKKDSEDVYGETEEDVSDTLNLQ